MGHDPVTPESLQKLQVMLPEHLPFGSNCSQLGMPFESSMLDALMHYRHVILKLVRRLQAMDAACVYAQD